jgi:hypothetical protein
MKRAGGRRVGHRGVGAAKESSQQNPGTLLYQGLLRSFSNQNLACLVIRIRRSRAVKDIEPIAGPSKSPRAKSREVSRGKRRAKSAREVEEGGRSDEEGAMHRRRIATRIIEKKVEIEMLWKEIEGLEEMLEE